MTQTDDSTGAAKRTPPTCPDRPGGQPHNAGLAALWPLVGALVEASRAETADQDDVNSNTGEGG